MTLEFYAKDVRFIIILHLFIVIFNTNGLDLKKHRCSKLVKQFTNIKFCLRFVKNKHSDTKLTVVDIHPDLQLLQFLLYLMTIFFSFILCLKVCCKGHLKCLEVQESH